VALALGVRVVPRTSARARLSSSVAVVMAAGQRLLAPAHTAYSRCSRGGSSAWAEHGTHIKLWTHFVSQFSGNAFALLWGYRFLALGVGAATAR